MTKVQKKLRSKRQRAALPAIRRLLVITDNSAHCERLMEQFVTQDYQIVDRQQIEDRPHTPVADTFLDAVVISTTSPDNQTLSAIRTLNENCTVPTLLFTAEGDIDAIDEAATAGVSAHIIGEVAARRVPAIMSVAAARFRTYHALKTELEAAKT